MQKVAQCLCAVQAVIIIARENNNDPKEINIPYPRISLNAYSLLCEVTVTVQRNSLEIKKK